MTTILDKVTTADIVRDPFPHVVIKNALPRELADTLLSQYPSPEYLAHGRKELLPGGKLPNNFKIRYYSSDILKDTILDRSWQQFVRAHITPEFFARFLEIFKADLITLHPEHRVFFDSLNRSQIGIKRVDNYHTKKVLLDAEICVDTPVRKVSSVRGIHLDHNQKLGVALLYL